MLVVRGQGQAKAALCTGAGGLTSSAWQQHAALNLFSSLEMDACLLYLFTISWTADRADRLCIATSKWSAGKVKGLDIIYNLDKDMIPVYNFLSLIHV